MKEGYNKREFDFSNQLLILEKHSRRITEKESEILHYMQSHRNKVIKREELLTALWGENDYFLGRSLDVFITKIRKYLKEDGDISIENVFGVGFVFNVKSAEWWFVSGKEKWKFWRRISWKRV